MTQMISQQLLDYLDHEKFTPGSDEYGWAALKWMNDHDPKGYGTLLQAANVVALEFTDGSKLQIDLTVGTLNKVQ